MGTKIICKLEPIGLSRVQAAIYIGVFATKFDELVRDGRMPHPRMIDARRVWSRDEIELAFVALPRVKRVSAGSIDPWGILTA